MEAPNPSGKATEVEPKPSHTQSSTMPTVQPANVTSNVEDEEDELADDDDVVMADVATGSSGVSSRPQSTPGNLPRSARAEGETTTAGLAPTSAATSAQNAPTTSTSTKKSHKPRAPKPEKSMMTSFKVRPPKEGTVNPAISTATPPGSVQLNVPAPVPTTEAAAPKTSKSTPTPKGQMKKRNRREEPKDPNVQVFYHDDTAAPATAVPKNEYPPEAVPSLAPPASKSRSPSKKRATQPEQPTEYFSIPVAEPLDLNGQPPKKWDTSYRVIQTISGATFSTRVWKSSGVKAEPLKPPPNWVLAPIYPTTSSGTAQGGSAADKAAGGAGTGTGTPTGGPGRRGRKSKAELAVLAAAAADGTLTPVGKRSKAPKKPKKEKVGKGTLVAAAVVDEPGSGAVTPSVLPEDVEMASAS